MGFLIYIDYFLLDINLPENLVEVLVFLPHLGPSRLKSYHGLL